MALSKDIPLISRKTLKELIRLDDPMLISYALTTIETVLVSIAVTVSNPDKE